MKKESKLSRIPAEDETPLHPPLPFLGMKFEVTAPESQMDELAMQWAKFVPTLKKLNKKSLQYKAVPKLRKAVKDVYAKNKFMLTSSDEDWVFNWSLAQKTFEINVGKKLAMSKITMLGAFGFGVMLYDSLRPPVKKFFARKIKQDKIPLQGIQKYLKFMKDGAQLGRARASFGFGFMMHLVQVSSKFHENPLFALVGEVLFDKKMFIINDKKVNERFNISELAPLAYQYDPARFDTIYAGKSEREINNMKAQTVGGIPFEDALDQTGIAPFFNALKKNITAAVNNPNHPRHANVMSGLGISRASQLDPSKFMCRVNPSSSSMSGAISYNGNHIANANRTGLSKSSQYNSLCEVRTNFQRLGSGMHMTASQIETAMRTGKKKIKVTAALSGGWKTWNKFGFESNSPVLIGIHSSGETSRFCEKSIDAKLYEMGGVDRQAILVPLMREMIQKYNLRFTAVAAAPTIQAPTIPPLPSDRNADVKRLLFAVISASGSYSSPMLRMLRNAGLPASNDRSSIETWMRSNTVTESQQQKAHDYFLSGTSSFETKFRRDWGYPPRAGATSRPRVNNTQVDSALKNMIEQWGWFGDQPFSADMVNQLIGSAQMDVVHGYKNLSELMAWMRTAGLEESSDTLKANRLTPRTQYMQDLMEVDGFTAYWDSLSSKPSWSGTMDLSDGKYSLSVLAMDRYRKLKIAAKPQLESDPAFQRSRLASYLDGFQIDSDILAKLGTTEAVELDGGISRVDLLLMEQALRDAQVIRKEIKDQQKEQEGEAVARIASRWLGGE